MCSAKLKKTKKFEPIYLMNPTVIKLPKKKEYDCDIQEVIVTGNLSLIELRHLFQNCENC